MALPWPDTARRVSVTRSLPPLRRCRTSCADPSLGTKARRWLSTPSCASTQDWRSSFVTRTVRGSAAQTRTPMASCDSTSRRAPTSASTAPATSERSLRLSTVARARPSHGRRQQRLSTNTYSWFNRPALRRPLEPGVRTSIWTHGRQPEHLGLRQLYEGLRPRCRLRTRAAEPGVELSRRLATYHFLV